MYCWGRSGSVTQEIKGLRKIFKKIVHIIIIKSTYDDIINFYVVSVSVSTGNDQ